MSFWDDCMSVHEPKQGDTAYPSMDGDDVVCSNCGYIIGWGDDGEEMICPSCGARIVWGVIHADEA